MEKRFIISKNKVHKKYTKSAQKECKNLFHFTDTDVYKNSILLFHFFVIRLSVKY